MASGAPESPVEEKRRGPGIGEGGRLPLGPPQAPQRLLGAELPGLESFSVWCGCSVSLNPSRYLLYFPEMVDWCVRSPCGRGF